MVTILSRKFGMSDQSIFLTSELPREQSDAMRLNLISEHQQWGMSGSNRRESDRPKTKEVN